MEGGEPVSYFPRDLAPLIEAVWAAHGYVCCLRSRNASDPDDARWCTTGQALRRAYESIHRDCAAAAEMAATMRPDQVHHAFQAARHRYATKVSRRP